MPVSLAAGETPGVQDRWDGGMNMYEPGANQYRDAKNIVIRDGKPTTRPGVRDYLAADGGFVAGFWFNEENARHNDATHTGFWFPFSFVRSPWGSVQGCQLIRLSIHSENKVIFAVGGAIFIYERGYVTEVGCSESIGSDESLEFVQANDTVYLFRSGDNPPLYWDGGDDGFVLVPDATVGDDIPHADNGLYHEGGRMWCSVDDDVYASAVLDFTEFDSVYRKWSIRRGSGEQGVILYPFHEDTILAFKKESISALVKVNAALLGSSKLSDYVQRQTVCEKTGAAAKWAIVTLGEDVLYLGYGGIYSLRRNFENKIEMDPVAMSEPIQSYIDRINWDAVSCACATTHRNYAIFAVPVDKSITNNLLIVYDRQTNGGRGAWVGVWESPVLNPVRFFHDGDKLIFLSADNIVREMFTNDPWDSENPYRDTPQYDTDKLYEPGEVCGFEYDGDRIWQAIVPTQGNAPPDTDYWEEVTDQWAYYDIESFVETRMPYGQGQPPMRRGPIEVLYRHCNPKVTISILCHDPGTEETVRGDIEYDRTEWDVADKGTWDNTNANLDFNDPYRKDYALLVGQDGIMADSNGLRGGAWQTHAEVFQPMTVWERETWVKVRNERGKLKLLSLSMLGQVGVYGSKATS